MKYLKVWENFSNDNEVENYNFKGLPTVFFNDEEYKGEAVFINGYNGYEKTEDDSFLCAIINGSAWNTEKQPNYLKDENGNLIHSENRRGQTINFV